MNKKEAIEFLGVSQRTLERYVDKGMLTVTYVKGKTSHMGVYDPDEVARLKEQINKPLPRRPVLVPEEQGMIAPVTAANAPAVTTIDDAVRQLANVLKSIRTNKPPSVPTSEKLILSIAEVSALTGKSRRKLMAAIKAGQLITERDSRRYNIIRKDLDEWIESLRTARRANQTASIGEQRS